MTLKNRIIEDMKTAMRAKNKDQLRTIRLILAAIKQQEVDTQAELDEATILATFDKLIKQRRESIRQYDDAGRDDLSQIEQAEVKVIQGYLPQQLSESEIATLMADAMAETGATNIRDMGKVMAYIKPKAQGRADIGSISSLIKEKLG